MSGFEMTIVVDNKGDGELVTEHGYCLHIRTPEGNVLLDTGQKDALLPNCEALGIDLANVSALVLSHGHYDHTGGVAEVIRRNREVEVYLHAAAFHPRYSLDGEKPNIVKMPLKAMEAVMQHDDLRVHWLTRPLSPMTGVGITGPVSRTCEFEDTGGQFFLDPAGREVDSIKDDVSVWLHGSEGLVVCLGCCHAGLINTLDYITSRTGEKRIATIIGGMHLLHAGTERLEKTVEGLKNFEIGRIVACHCSGDEAVKYLSENLPCEVVAGYAGMTLSAN